MNDTYPSMENLEHALLSMGFKDVTKDYPISFCEMIQGWDNIFILSKRFARKKDGVLTFLNIGGDNYYRLQFTGRSIFEGRSRQFASEVHKSDFKLVLKYINDNEEYVRDMDRL